MCISLKLDSISCSHYHSMVRPGAPNTALSSYASGIVREPLKGEKAVCPVPMDFKVFVSSPATVVSNFVHLMLVDASKYPSWTRTCALPGISVSTREILDALQEVGGKKAVELVEIKPDVSRHAACTAPLQVDERVKECVRERDQQNARQGVNRAHTLASCLHPLPAKRPQDRADLARQVGDRPGHRPGLQARREHSGWVHLVLSALLLLSKETLLAPDTAL